MTPFTRAQQNERSFADWSLGKAEPCWRPVELPSLRNLGTPKLGKSNGGFSEGGLSNNRFVLKPDVAIASEVSILSKNSLAITDFHVKKMQHVQLFENPLPGTPQFAIPKKGAVADKGELMK